MKACASSSCCRCIGAAGVPAAEPNVRRDLGSASSTRSGSKQVSGWRRALSTVFLLGWILEDDVAEEQAAGPGRRPRDSDHGRGGESCTE